MVGSRFRGPAVTLSDLADNIQAKTHTRMPFLGGAPLQWLEKVHQSLPIDSRTTVAYFDANIGLLARHRDAHRRVRYTVMDCIGDEVSEQLLHPSTAPRTLAVAHDIQF